MKASGEFDISLQPLESYVASVDPNQIGRMSIDKTYKGDLDAVASGEMLTARTYVAGSAGYVAIEQVTGTLAGKTGSFVLQHSGTMANGSDTLEVGVVPDSGTGELAGLSGQLSIRIDDGKHFYEFDYEFAK